LYFKGRCRVLYYGGVGEEHTEGAQQGKQYLTVGEAAKLLGVHRNTIHHRIKTGRIKAHKVFEDDREVYRIDGDSLDVGRASADMHTLDAQRTMAGEELARMPAIRLDQIVRAYAQELGEVREQLGAERERRYQAERERDDIKRDLEEIRPSSKPWWVLGLLVIVVVTTVVALSLWAITSTP
jgi:excisionase family DNA binding protein